MSIRFLPALGFAKEPYAGMAFCRARVRSACFLALCPTVPSSTRAPIIINESHEPDGNFYRAVLCIALILSSCLTGKSQTPIKSRPLPLGTLVDVGGYRVHLYCLGQGSPTVMIVGAAFSFDWALVQPEVAKFTRVCTFDPSGTAWSDPFKTATAPNCNQRVDEIHQLIMKAPVDGPYVLVGYSVGAQWARLYAARYSNNIVGMVIVDHAFIPGQGHTRCALA